MFKRKDLKDNPALIEAAQKRAGELNTFGERFTEINGLKDPADKILKLQKLEQDIRNAEWKFDRELQGIAKTGSGKTGWKVGGAWGTGIAAGLAVPAVLLSPVILVFGSAVLLAAIPAVNASEAKKTSNKEKLNQETVNLSDVNDALKTGITEALQETVRKCDLGDATKSEWFAEAFESYKPLRDRFAAAAAAKAALGETAPEDVPAQARPVKKPHIHL